MCLTIAIEIPMMPKDEARRLAGQHRPSENVDLHFEGTASFAGRGNPRLSLSEAGEGCACSMLTDDADWNAPAWDIRPVLLPYLANTLRFISERAPNGFILEALWAGDKPGENLELSLDELLNLVRANRIGTRARYNVRAA